MQNNTLLQDDLTWDLTTVFKNDQLWELEFQSIEKILPTIADYKNQVTETAQGLFDTLEFDHELGRRINLIYLYSCLKSDEDTTNETYLSMHLRAQSLFIQLVSATSFIIPAILAMDEKLLEQYKESHEGLTLYRHYLEEIYIQKSHKLSSEQEELFSQLEEIASAPSQIYHVLTNAEIDFPMVTNEVGEKIQLSHGIYHVLLESQNRVVRKEAFLAMYETYQKQIQTFASTLSNHVKATNKKARIRHYSSARHAAMSQYSIPEKVYDQLLSTTKEHLPLFHRYMDLRKRLLGVESLHLYDVSVPLKDDVALEISYGEAKKIIIESVAPFGEDYQKVIQQGFDNRWIDVVENKGKKTGAYSFGAFGTNPFILMNWQNNMDSLVTLTHEFGHSMHSYYTRQTQSLPYANYSPFLGEIAATCHEELLFEYLLNKTEDTDEKIHLLHTWLQNFCNVVFVQAMYAEFEQTIYEWDSTGEALTAQKLTDLYSKLMKNYYGKALTVDEVAGVNWARITHFHYNFYVYQYATGKSAALMFSKQILEQGKPATELYINAFLKAGNSDFPIDILKNAGVDMESSEPFIEACKVFEEKLTLLEDLLCNK